MTIENALPVGLRILETFTIKQHKVLRNCGFNTLVRRLEKCAGSDKNLKCAACIFIEPCKNRFDKICDRDIA